MVGALLIAGTRLAGESRSRMEEAMSKPQPIEYAEASREVRAVFDDIKKSRNVADVNNFWKYLARDPALLKRTWKSVKT